MPHPVLFYTTNIKFDLNSKPVEISLKKNSIQLIIVSFLCFHTTVWKMTSNFSQVLCSNWNGNCFIKKRVKSDWQPNFFGSCISLQHRGKSLGEIDFLCITFQTKKERRKSCHFSNPHFVVVKYRKIHSKALCASLIKSYLWTCVKIDLALENCKFTMIQKFIFLSFFWLKKLTTFHAKID